MTTEQQIAALDKVRKQAHALHERALTAMVHLHGGHGTLDAYAAERMVGHAREALATATALHNVASGQPQPKQG